MNVKSVEKEATRASVTVELTREELEPALNRAYLKYRKDIMIPGFRKGHAPRMVIEAAYGKHVFFEDAVEDPRKKIYYIGIGSVQVLLPQSLCSHSCCLSPC